MITGILCGIFLSIPFLVLIAGNREHKTSISVVRILSLIFAILAGALMLLAGIEAIFSGNDASKAFNYLYWAICYLLSCILAWKCAPRDDFD
jgi:hypothetical protein